MTDIFCPVHREITQDLRDIKEKQASRSCSGHEERLRALERSDERLERDNNDQWTAINQLRRLVWGWAGIAAFLGSAAGSLLISYFVKAGTGK
jgi:hypothetical protein